jgi:hypothetical protein
MLRKKSCTEVFHNDMILYLKDPQKTPRHYNTASAKWQDTKSINKNHSLLYTNNE